MSTADFKKMLENIVCITEHYGVYYQMIVWIEKMSELTKEICKWSRNYDELESDLTEKMLQDLKEEIADVTICLEQLKYAIRYEEDELLKNCEKKVDRQMKRIEVEFND